MSNQTRQDLAEIGRTFDEKELQGDERLFQALVSGCHVENAAVVAGISERTAYRRLANAEFRKQLDDARQALRESILAKLADAAHDAIGVLSDLMIGSEDERIRLHAAKSLLDSLMQNQRQQSTRSDEVNSSKPEVTNVVVYIPDNGRDSPAIPEKT